MIQAKIAVLFSILLILVGSVATKKVSADEITITGNGEATKNEASVSSNNTTTVTANNTTNTENNVQVNANTGDNSTSGNTGDSQIQTGDVHIDTNIQNEGNSSVVNVDNCCGSDGSNISIANNGSESVNTAGSHQNNSTNITVNQHANITNNVHINANTGGNNANHNTGNVAVQTGSISVKTTFNNGPVNTATVNIMQGGNRKVTVDISGNGTNSLNLINYLNTNTNTAQVNNIANIFNNELLNLNTGDNDASDNLGDVSLITGDILIETEITNSVNAAKIDITCGCHEKAPEKPEQPTIPPQKVTPPSAGGENPTSPGGGGEVAGISLEKALPVTGGNWLFLAFIGNIMMLFLGMILRLRSGNAPGLVAVA